MVQGNVKKPDFSSSERSYLGSAVMLGAMLLGTACAASSKVAMEDGVPAQFADGTSTPSETPMRCPSQDFATFLRKYMDAEHDEARVNFTAEPVQYLMPFYLVEEPTATSPEMHVSRLTGADRFRHLPFRYFEAVDGYYRVDESEKATPATALQSKEARYPLKIVAGENGEREAIFGLEYEIDIYRFTRRADCWYLTQIINSRD